MKKLCKTLVALLLVLVCAFSFASCKKDKGGNSDSTIIESNVPEATATTTAKVITVNVAAPTRFEEGYIKYKGQTLDDYTMRKRFVRLCTLVEYFSPDVIMMQEVNGRGAWWDYLVEGEDTLLKRFPKYSFVGSVNLANGADGAGNRGAFYNQVYYNTKKYELVAGGTFFCRDDKTKPENNFTGDYEGEYNASNTTTCSWAVLRDKTTKVTAVFGSTHLCTRPDSAQCFRNYGQARNLTEGLYDVAEKYKWGSEPLPIVVAGDFNGDPSHTNFYSYEHMTVNAHYTDSKLAAPVEDNSGTARIFGKTLTNNGSRIDYIFSQGAEVTDYKVLKGTFAEDKAQTYCEYNTEAVLDGSQYDLTDHLPVYAKLKISGASTSEAPEDYFNPITADDAIITDSSEINATANKIVFDSPDLLKYIGNKENKGMSADIVYLENGNCLRLMLKKSRIDPVISIEYGALMRDLGLTPVSADNCRKIKVKYRLVKTKSPSLWHFGATNESMIPLSIGTNTLQVLENEGNWNTYTFDFSFVDKDFWSGKFTYFGVKAGSGMMAGDGIYIESIELL